MKLNSLARPQNEHSCSHSVQRELDERCRYLWYAYLDTLMTGEPVCDVVVWEFGPKVTVRPASSFLDETNSKFQRSPHFYFELKGLSAEIRKLEKQKNVDSEVIAQQVRELESKTAERLKNAIVKSLTKGGVLTRYKKSGCAPFTILMTSKDVGLLNSAFELVWKHDSAPSLATIVQRAKANRGKPLPTNSRLPSARQLRLKRIQEENKQWKIQAKEQKAAREKKVAEKKPDIAKQLLKQIGAQEMHWARELGIKKQPLESQGFLLSLDDGNQFHKRVVPQVPIDDLAEIIASYSWSDFYEYDNRLYEYWEKLMRPVMTKVTGKSFKPMWQKMNRAQKVFHTLSTFNGETDNGGVWQFLFNDPELSLATLEALLEIGASGLAVHYKLILEEVVGKGKTISEIRNKANTANLNTSKGWEAFAEGYGELTSAKTIEKYFYKPAFKKTFFKRICDYVESHFSLLASFERKSPRGSSGKAIG